MSVALNAIEEERGGGKVEGGCVALTNCHFACLQAIMSLSFSWVGHILWVGKAEKGEVTLLLKTSEGADSRSAHLSFQFLKGRAGYPGLGLHLSPFLATG